MSNQHLTAARRVRGISPYAKAALMVLADAADEAGECFPAIGTLSAESCVPERTLTRALAELEAGGHITRRRRFNASSLYQIHPVPTPDGEVPSPNIRLPGGYTSASQAGTHPPPRRLTPASQAGTHPPPRPSNPHLTPIEPQGTKRESRTPKQASLLPPPPPRPESAIDRVAKALAAITRDPGRSRGWAVKMLEVTEGSEEAVMDAVATLRQPGRWERIRYPRTVLPQMAREALERRTVAATPPAEKPDYVSGWEVKTILRKVFDAIESGDWAYPDMETAVRGWLRDGLDPYDVVVRALTAAKRRGLSQFPTERSLDNWVRAGMKRLEDA